MHVSNTFAKDILVEIVFHTMKCAGFLWNHREHRDHVTGEL